MRDWDTRPVRIAAAGDLHASASNHSLIRELLSSVNDPDLYSFLGTSRLEEPLDRYAVDAAFHGHAHHGAPQGCTRAGVPVYNVAVPVLRRSLKRPPYLQIVELAAAAAPRATAAG